MAIIYNAALKSARMTKVIEAIDHDMAPGKLVIVGGTYPLVSITLARPSFTESDGEITMAGAPRSGVPVAEGTATEARIEDGAGTIVISGLTVGTSGAQINLNSVVISSDQTVTLNSGLITHG